MHPMFYHVVSYATLFGFVLSVIVWHIFEERNSR